MCMCVWIMYACVYTYNECVSGTPLTLLPFTAPHTEHQIARTANSNKQGKPRPHPCDRRRARWPVPHGGSWGRGAGGRAEGYVMCMCMTCCLALCGFARVPAHICTRWRLNHRYPIHTHSLKNVQASPPLSLRGDKSACTRVPLGAAAGAAA